METRTIETQISMGNVKDQVAAFLEAIGYIQSNEELVSLDLGIALSSAFPQISETALVPLKITLRKKPEVKVIVHNGGKKEAKL